MSRLKTTVYQIKKFWPVRSSLGAILSEKRADGILTPDAKSVAQVRTQNTGNETSLAELAHLLTKVTFVTSN